MMMRNCLSYKPSCRRSGQKQHVRSDVGYETELVRVANLLFTRCYIHGVERSYSPHGIVLYVFVCLRCILTNSLTDKCYIVDRTMIDRLLMQCDRDRTYDRDRQVKF
eukprot:732439_1